MKVELSPLTGRMLSEPRNVFVEMNSSLGRDTMIILKSRCQAMRDVEDCLISDDDIHYHLNIVASCDRHLCRWCRNSADEIDRWRCPFSNEKDTVDREESRGKHPSSIHKPFHHCIAVEESIRVPWSLGFPSERENRTNAKDPKRHANLKFMEIFWLHGCSWTEINET